MELAAYEVAANCFLEAIPSLHLGKSGRLTPGGATLNPDDKLFMKLFRLLSLERQQSLLTELGVNYLPMTKGSDTASIYMAMVNALEGTSRDKRLRPKAQPEVGQAYFNDAIKTPLSELKLILNLEDRKRSFLYDPKRDVIHRIDYEIILDRIKSVLGKDAAYTWIETNSIDSRIVYRPNNPRIYKDIQSDYMLFNMWNEASWRIDWRPTPEPIPCPPELDAFMRALFPEDECRHSVYCWIRDAVFGRAGPILILCGIPGAGKNIFVQSLVANLVGVDNYRSASRGFNKSQFHNGVSKCRLFFLDEMPLSAESRETLKAYHNGQATIERKGKDVEDPEPIFASFVIANNTPHKVVLEYTDRKFFAPVISSIPLTQQWDKQRIDNFVERLSNDATFLQEIASHLFHAYEPGEAIKFKKNAFFKRLCLNSFTYDFRMFHYACSKAQTIDSRAMAKTRRRHVDPFMLRDVLEQYEQQFGEKLAHLEIDPSGTWKATSLIFNPGDKPLANGNGAHIEIPSPTLDHAGEQVADVSGLI